MTMTLLMMVMLMPMILTGNGDSVQGRSQLWPGGQIVFDGDENGGSA